MDSIERQKQQVNNLISEMTAHRWEEAVDAFEGESPAFEDVPANVRLTGKSGIARAYQSLSTALPDLTIEISHASDVPGYSVRELLFTGTHQGTYQGLEATGQRIRFACACFFLFDPKGRLMTERVYFDNDTLLQQMRGRSQPYVPRQLCIAS